MGHRAEEPGVERYPAWAELAASDAEPDQGAAEQWGALGVDPPADAYLAGAARWAHQA